MTVCGLKRGGLRATADSSIETSREILLSIGIDMHVSVLRILEIACEHEKDTRLLDHMHDIADSNRHIAIKALQDLSTRLDHAAAQRPQSRISNSRYPGATPRRLSSQQLTARLSTAAGDQSMRNPVYAPHLAKLKASNSQVTDIMEEDRQASIGQVSIQPGPIELDAPYVTNGPRRATDQQDTSVPRRDRTAVLPRNWLRSMFCMRTHTDDVADVDAPRPRVYTPEMKRASTASMPSSMPVPDMRSYRPKTPLYEMAADTTSSDPNTIPAMAELDDNVSIASTISSPYSLNESSIMANSPIGNTTRHSGPDTPVTVFSDISGGFLSKRTSNALLSPVSPVSRDVSPIITELTIPILPSPTKTHRTGTFCPGNQNLTPEALDLLLLPGARKLSNLTDNATPPPTVHFRCPSCALTSPALHGPAVPKPGTITSASQLKDITKSDLALPDDIIVHRGISYRWRFLASSHLVPATGLAASAGATSGGLSGGARYGCVFCAAISRARSCRAGPDGSLLLPQDGEIRDTAALSLGCSVVDEEAEEVNEDTSEPELEEERNLLNSKLPGRTSAELSSPAGRSGKPVDAFASVDDLLRHVHEHHAGELSDEVQRVTRCVDARLADDADKSWDVNICLFE